MLLLGILCNVSPAQVYEVCPCTVEQKFSPYMSPVSYWHCFKHCFLLDNDFSQPWSCFHIPTIFGDFTFASDTRFQWNTIKIHNSLCQLGMVLFSFKDDLLIASRSPEHFSLLEMCETVVWRHSMAGYELAWKSCRVLMGPYFTIENTESFFLVERLITSAPIIQFITKSQITWLQSRLHHLTLISCIN